MRKTTVNKRTGAGIVGRRGSRRRSSRGGFTLIELVVVIGIMLLLLGLTLSVGVAVRTQSETRETQNILRLLDTAMQEWERSADRQLSWGEDDDPSGSVYDVWGRPMQLLTPEILVITEVLQTVIRPHHVKEITAQIDADFIYTYRTGEFPSWIQSPDEQDAVTSRFIGAITVLDAWGQPIYATHPGRVSDPAVFAEDVNPIYGPDDDGTIQTYNERSYGVAENRRVCFVSAGPDGMFGQLDAPAGSAFFEQTTDNLYSYPVSPPQ